MNQTIQPNQPLENFTVHPNNILIKMSIKPPPKNGLLVPGDYYKNELAKNRMGIVLQIGTCALSTDTHSFAEAFPLEVGDWVVIKPYEGSHFIYDPEKAAWEKSKPGEKLPEDLDKTPVYYRAIDHGDIISFGKTEQLEMIDV